MIFPNPSHSCRRRSGFTLIELMITVVIVAILVGIAVPAYTSQVRKSRRTDARNAILDIAAREERFLSLANAYTAVPTDLGYPGAAWPQNVTNNFYSVNVTLPAGPNPAFLITATAIGIQAGDTACATLSLNQIGQQTATGSPTASVDCWQ